MVSWVTIEGFWIYLVGSNEWVASNWILVFTHRFLGSPRGQHCNSLEGNQGFHLRPEAGRFVRSFAIPGTLRSILAIFTTVNGVSEYSILKISWGSMPPDPPRCLRLWRSRGTLRCQENIHVRCFQMSATLQNSWKPCYWLACSVKIRMDRGFFCERFCRPWLLGA